MKQKSYKKKNNKKNFFKNIFNLKMKHNYL